MDREERSEYLFNWLKRDGECWHELTAEKSDTNFAVCVCGYWSGGRGWQNHLNQNPDFFDPKNQAAINFFWLWDRLIEQVWYSKFAYTHNHFTSYREVPPNLISCTELAKALYEFKGKHGDN